MIEFPESICVVLNKYIKIIHERKLIRNDLFSVKLYRKMFFMFVDFSLVLPTYAFIFFSDNKFVVTGFTNLIQRNSISF